MIDRSKPRPPKAKSPLTQWLPAAAAVGLLGTVVMAGAALGGGRGSGDDSAAASSTSAQPVFSPPESTPEVVATVETTAPVVKTMLDRTLAKGVAGKDVKDVQERLTSLGFVPGPADGIYGEQTIKAVWAYEKLVLGVDRDEPTGQVTPEMWEAMQEPFVVQPRRPNSTPNHTEVYLPEQVIAIFHDDVPVMISHMSSGSGEEWCEEVTISPGEYGNREGLEPIKRGECGISTTPGGVYEFYRQVEGIRESALGSMWNPVYFNYGIAIHGALNVPLQPASHGCIRVPLSISENLQDLISMGDTVFVFDGVKEPEEYGDQPPRFNWPDPDYVSTTTTTIPETTTTVPETSTTVVEAPTTTVVAPPSTPAPTTSVASVTTTSTTTTSAPAPAAPVPV